MRPERTRDMVTNAILVGLVFGGVIYWQTRDFVQVLPATVIMAISAYFGSLTARRIGLRIGKRLAGPPPVEIAPPQPSSERPQHAQHRRSRRRPRRRQR